MRWVFLIAGLAVGYFLGQTRTEVTRAERPVNRAADVPDRSPPADRGPSLHPVASSAGDTARTVDTQPPVTSGDGILEILWPHGDREIGIHLYGRGLRGDEVDIPIGKRKGDVTTLRLPGGRYRLVASRDGWAAERKWRFLIPAGGYTKIDLTRPPRPHDFPIPPGMGRLDFRVSALDGAALPRVFVNIFGTFLGKEEDVGERADSAGRGRVHLRPGKYRVGVGAQEQEIEIVAGETKAVEFRYRGEGAVLVQGAVDPDHVELLGVGRIARSGDRLVYVKTGRFQVALGNGGRKKPLVVGVVDVVAGRVAIFRFDGPFGELDIRLRNPEGHWPGNVTLRLVPLDGSPVIEVRPHNSIFLGASFGIRVTGLGITQRAQVRYLPYGRYRVEFEAEGWRTSTTTVELEDSTTLRIDLPIQRASDD